MKPPENYIPCVGLTNEQVYQLVVETQGMLPLLMHPKQLEYVKKRLQEDETIRETKS